MMDVFSIGYFLLFGLIVEYRGLESMLLISAVIPIVLGFVTKIFLDRATIENSSKTPEN